MNKYLYVIWAIIISIAALRTYNNTVIDSERRLIGDQSSHIMSSLSIYNDFDLKYTLEDLDRFRKIMPKEPGPRGVYLKKGDEGSLFYAKPFLYAAASAPFVGILGLKGFIIINSISLLIIGMLSIYVLGKKINSLYCMILVLSMFIFSPFLVWLPIAHPDIFIPCLLLTGTILFLKYNVYLSSIGSFILGLTIYEKPTFIIFIIFLLCVKLFIEKYRYKYIFYIAIFIIAGWFLPTSINIIQDGNILAYQGLRFYVETWDIGSYPLENDWKGLPDKGITDYVFNIKNILVYGLKNLQILPHKLFDFIFGRQTGILLYFPTFLLLIFFIVFNINIKSIIMLTSFLAYMFIYWVLFPENGYGGSQSYGSRYMMQALPILIISFNFSKFKISNQKTKYRLLNYTSIIIFVCMAILFQHQVVFSKDNYFVNPDLFLISPLAKKFPYEDSLLRTISTVMDNSFEDSYKELYKIYRITGDDDNSYCYPIKNKNHLNDHFIYVKLENNQNIPEVLVDSTQYLELSVIDNDDISKYKISPFKPTKIKINNDFDNHYYQLDKKKISWDRISLKSDLISENNNDIPGFYNISFNNFENNIGYTINDVVYPHQFLNSGIRPIFCWKDVNGNSIQSDGILAGFDIMFNKNIEEDIYFRVRYDTENINNLLDFKVFINDNFLAQKVITSGKRYQVMTMRIPKEMFKNNSNRIFFVFNEETQYLQSSLNIYEFSFFNFKNSNNVNIETMYLTNINGKGINLLGSGWSHAEDWGIWSIDYESEILLPVDFIQKDTNLQFEVQGFKPLNSKPLEVLVYINDIFLDKWIFENNNFTEIKSINIYKNDIKDKFMNIIKFYILNPRSPNEYNLSQDVRKLGIGLKKIIFTNLQKSM